MIQGFNRRFVIYGVLGIITGVDQAGGALYISQNIPGNSQNRGIGKYIRGTK